ncbi:hypothetical protein VTJ83DRAFT_3174 [Remersonia thermophila]|uniref:DNA replication regulator SLD2 n=1 Tax=Remersonia thermophila TaxID=72144 RepID=A0ABR4DDA8_9PEZI
MPHKTMDDQARAAYEEQCLQLRAQLKKWEGEWAAANGGSKPGRADIKQNPDIARKYKQYNKLRDMLAGKIPPPKQAPASPAEAALGSQQRKRTHSDDTAGPQTPSKKLRPAQTPQKTRHAPLDVAAPAAQTPLPAHAAMTPSAGRTSLTPAEGLPTSISPTPQRDGRVLGIFDLLGRTPSQRGTPAASALPTATPSKHGAHAPQPLPVATTPSTARLVEASTPRSAQRPASQLLFKASTPRKAKDGAAAAAATPFKTPSANRISNPAASTPSSSTPSFLRRRTTFGRSAAGGGLLSRVDEQDENDDDAEAEWKKVGPLKLPRRLTAGVAKGLSSVVAGLRKMEDEAFAEDEEALREMEMDMEMTYTEGRGVPNGKAAADAGAPAAKEAAGKEGPAEPLGQAVSSGGEPGGIDAAPDRPVGLLSAFDDEALLDSPDEGQGEQRPLRQFKKRGQKRTTRLVKMRPTRTKRPANAESRGSGCDTDEDEEAVRETQLGASNPPGGAAGDLGLSDKGSDASDATDGSDYDGSDVENDGGEETGRSRPRKTKEAKKETKAASATAVAAAAAKKKAGESEGVVKRAVRKVKATAHANFRRLKLRNSGAKGGPAHNSRFRRRR